MSFTQTDVKAIIDKLGVNLKSVKNKGVTEKRLLKGIESEMTLRKTGKKEDHTKIFEDVMSHLKEDPRYYSTSLSKLKKKQKQKEEMKDSPIEMPKDMPKEMTKDEVKIITTKGGMPKDVAKKGAAKKGAAKKGAVKKQEPVKEEPKNEVTKKKREPNEWIKLMQRISQEVPAGTPLMVIREKAKKEYKPAAKK